MTRYVCKLVCAYAYLCVDECFIYVETHPLFNVKIGIYAYIHIFFCQYIKRRDLNVCYDIY
jgi:hypothetical protein